MVGVIMAGGFGTRLKPLTCNIPKPMVPVMNRPMMEHIILLLKEHGITDLVSLLFHQPDTITNYFGGGESTGTNLKYLLNTEDYGTAGSVKKAESHLNERFLVISGDLLTDIDLSQAIQFHIDRQAKATIILTRVKNPLEYGIVMADQSGRITRFLEKPSWGQVFSDTINSGLYILEPEVLDFIPPATNFDFSKDLFPILLDQNQSLYGYIASGYWKDVGNLTEYQLAHRDCLAGNMKIRLQGKRNGNAWIGEETVIGKNVSFEGHVVIGPKCVIGNDVTLCDTVIGDRCRIDEASHLINSVLWNNVELGKRVRLNNDVVASKTSIHTDSYISEHVFISENCTIGHGCTIRSNIKIWPDKALEDGAVLIDSLIWGDRWMSELFTGSRITGLVNSELTPEIGAKLGAAYGAYVGAGNALVTSRDVSEGARMICRALESGFMAAGVHVHDLRVTPIPIVRNQLRSGKEQGGIHVRQSPFDDKLVDILFFDLDGRDLPINKTKAIERLFFREDFPRAAYHAIGKLDFPVRITDSYVEEFLKHLNPKPIENAHFKVVVDYSHGGASQALPNLLGSLDCEVISVNAYLDSRRLTRDAGTFHHQLHQLSKVVTSLKANIGFLMDAGAEKLFVVDEKGIPIDSDRLLVLVTKILIEANDPKKIAVPVTASALIESLAEARDIRVIRTRNEHRSLMEAFFNEGVKFAGDTKGGFIFTDFSFSFDGMFALAKILELMARTNISIGKLNNSLPRVTLKKINVPCSREHKGYVMRKLMEFTEGKTRQLIDGVKIFEDGGWVLVMPDHERAFFHVNAEAEDRKLAVQLVTDYVEQIKGWIFERE
ncbi:NTP transferase domain-containing protein [candidate division KSB1 bacterium]|nr:NTP transferase domain-containing protein [candidate division KSB1 bacterium]